MADHFMETMREAVERFERDGFGEAFRADRGGELTVDGRVLYAPEDLVVEEMARFEGSSDPGDAAVIFALRTPDGAVRGTFSASYGPQADPDVVEAVRRLDVRPERARPATQEIARR